MVFVACGLNHKTAPLNLREKVALSSARQDTLLNKLIDLPDIQEAALLSTCNRTEIYCDTSDPSRLAAWLAKEYQLSPRLLTPHFYIHSDHQGIRHILRVASGVDSMMVGEPQILGQLKQAYQNACKLGTVKTLLRPVFEYTFRASKRIRNRSGIGNNPVSVAYTAVQLVSEHFPNLSNLRVFLIGSGETASLVAKYLHQEGVKSFFVASRTQENAKNLASDFQGEALTITDIPYYLPQADIIISATACPLPFINKKMVQHALEQRNQAPLFFLDLAVPRDIEPEVAELENVQLYNIDDLQIIAEKGMNERRNAASQAETLIECELDNYLRWYRSRKAKDLICDYRDHMKQLTQQELERALQKLSNGQCQQQVFQEFSERLLNKLTHLPTAGLKQAAWDGRKELLDLAQYLLNTSKSQQTYEEIT